MSAGGGTQVESGIRRVPTHHQRVFISGCRRGRSRGPYSSWVPIGMRIRTVRDHAVALTRARDDEEHRLCGHFTVTPNEAWIGNRLRGKHCGDGDFVQKPPRVVAARSNYTVFFLGPTFVWHMASHCATPACFPRVSQETSTTPPPLAIFNQRPLSSA